MGKKKSESGTSGKTVGISITISIDLLTDIDKYQTEHDFPSRSALIETACNNYIHLIKCDVCGALNPENGRNCSVCGTDINRTIDDYTLQELKIMSRSDPNRFQAIMKKIDPEFNEWIDIRQKEMEDIKKTGEYYKAA